MDAEFLKLVRCPITLTKLSPADERLLAAVNRKIDAGQLSNRIGQAVTEPLQAGLVNGVTELERPFPVMGNMPPRQIHLLREHPLLSETCAR